MLSNLNFLKYTVALSFGTLAWWIYVAGAPLMFHRMHLSAAIIGMLYFPAVLPYISTGFISRHLLKTKSVDEMVKKGMTFIFLAVFILPIFSILGMLNVWTIMIGVALITASNGLFIGATMSAGIAQFSKNSGLASGLLGTIQLLAGAFASFLISIFSKNFDSNYFSWMTFILTMIGVFLFVILSIAVRKSFFTGPSY